MNGILFFLIAGLQIIALLPSKITKIKYYILFPLLSLPLYIKYESYFRQPEVLATIPIRIDILVLHPLIIAAFLFSIVRSIMMIKIKKLKASLALTAIVAGFIYWWYYILVICKFYQ